MTRRRRKTDVAPFNPSLVLERPIRMADGSSTLARAYELGMRKCATKAIGGNMRDAEQLLKECRRYGLLDVPEPVDDHEYAIYVPKEWDYAEFLAQYDRFGSPPWPGERDGLIPLERWRPHHNGRIKLR